ncbi:MAG: YitT family protein [Enterococcus sp.]|uniref:YitT family protein n=1 Tax=Enterococcus sp. DIV1314a TaxID=2774660 RepID=UPI001B777C17|nr:YitT family protein [Enterococcus sp.]MBP7953159.1 YitT family protein [Enterococcus sp.]MBP8693748.1 YitT family protein [Enterococcus sp.]HRL51391.1 YitT family protein [Enterococcus aquimarinus]HRM23897.1 YitT family protein [Enterococcus aquimarinus]
MDKFWKYLPHSNYATKISTSIVYAITASAAVNFFYEPGNIYSSGVTGIAQIIGTLAQSAFGIKIPVALALLLLNLPLFILGWFKISPKFTIFTGITVLLTSVFMQIIPVQVLSTDPIINAIFGGVVMGAGGGYALRNGLSSGGLDFITIAIRKKTGKTIGSLSIIFNSFILLAAGLLFGWQYAFYSALAIFVSGKVMDAVFTKQKKMQVTIVTSCADEVIHGIHGKMRRGITIINGAEGAFRYDRQKVLITVVTRYELPLLKQIMRETDPHAFVSIADNVQILGRFYEEDL